MQRNRRREIRIKAESFREKCKVSRYGIMDLFTDCERNGYKVIRYPLGESAELGFAMQKDNDTIIFINSCSRLSREIFTLAHEIGHILLHMNTSMPFIDNNMTLTGSSTDVREQEANYFAACLLMPSDEVEKFLDLEVVSFEENRLTAMDITRMMSEFNVSFDMALNRLEYLGKISPGERLKLDDEKTKRRVGNLLRSVGGNSRLNVPGNDIDIPYEYIDYVIYNYNHSAIPKETLERALSCYHLTMEDISDRLRRHCGDEDDLDALIGDLED